MKSYAALPLAGILALGNFACAQQTAVTAVPATTNISSPASSSAEVRKPRVFVTDSDSWETQSAAGGTRSGCGASSSGGARPQTAEVIKTLGERCPQVTVNARPDVSDYVFKLDHEGGKGYLRKDTKAVIFIQRTGDSIFSKSTMTVGGAVQDACIALTAHWTSHGAEIAAMSSAPIESAPAPSAPPAPVALPINMATLQIESSVPGADIEIDGAFAGNTPSTLTVTPGQHTIAIKKKGYTDWTRTMNVSGAAVHLNPELDLSK